MIDIKSEVAQALISNAEITAIVADRIFYYKPPSIMQPPCIIYREDDNSAAEFADNGEIGSEIIVIVDVFANSNTFVLANLVNTAMVELGFVREYARDLLSNGAYQKHLRFKTIRRVEI